MFEGKTPFTVILDHLESKEGNKLDLMNHFVSDSKDKVKSKIEVMNPEDYLDSTHKEVQKAGGIANFMCSSEFTKTQPHSITNFD